MNRYIPLSMLAGFLFVISLGGCSKKTDNPAPQKTQAQLLTAATVWKLTKLELFDKTSNAWVNEPIDDDSYISYLTFFSISFTADGKLTLTGSDGANAPHYTDTGTWAITDAIITITPNNEDVQTSTIDTLTATTWVTSWTMTATGFNDDNGHGTAVLATGVRETFAAGN